MSRSSGSSSTNTKSFAASPKLFTFCLRPTSRTILISLGDLRLKQSESPGGIASSGYFDLIPDEIAENIFDYLAPQDMVSALRLSIRLNNIIKNSMSLRYSFVLRTSGLVDGHKARSMDDKLTEILKREEAWRAIDTSRRLSIPGYDTLSRIYGLTNGIAFGDVCESVSEDRDRGSETLKLLDFSDCSKLESGKEFCREMSIPGAGQIIDVCLAVAEHDLMGIIASRAIGNEWIGDVVVHLRQHSTGLPHPHAMHPKIFTKVFLTNEYWDSILVRSEVVGSYMVILLSNSRKDVLLLINWWKGEIIKREEVPTKTYGAFAFLTHDLLLLSNGYTKLFEIIRLPGHDEQLDSDMEKTFKRIACLHLPRQMADDFDERIDCCSAPNPTNPIGTRHPTELDPARSRYPYTADPECAIIVVKPANDVMLVVRRHALVEAINAFITSITMPSKEGLGVHIPWAYWALGPNGGIVRWIRGECGFNSTNFGQRLVGIQAREFLTIKDFNPYAVKRARASLLAEGNVLVSASESSECGANSEVYEKKSRVSTSHRAPQQDDMMCIKWLNDCTFMRLIESNVSPDGTAEEIGELPYVETVTQLEDDDYENVFTDGERLILTRKWDNQVTYLDLYAM